MYLFGTRFCRTYTENTTHSLWHSSELRAVYCGCPPNSTPKYTYVENIDRRLVYQSSPAVIPEWMRCARSMHKQAVYEQSCDLRRNCEPQYNRHVADCAIEWTRHDRQIRNERWTTDTISICISLTIKTDDEHSRSVCRPDEHDPYFDWETPMFVWYVDCVQS